MTPDEAYDLTRDKAASLISAYAQSQGLALSVGQIVQMLDTAFEEAGLRVLLALAQTADLAASGYAGTYDEPPEDVEDVDGEWRNRRLLINDYPNLRQLFTE